MNDRELQSQIKIYVRAMGQLNLLGNVKLTDERRVQLLKRAGKADQQIRKLMKQTTSQAF